MSVLLSADKLMHGRTREVQKMLRPFWQTGKPVSCDFAAHPKGRLITAPRTGTAQQHEGRWFATSSNSIQAQYHEMWYPQNGEREWVLARAYFSLRRVISSSLGSTEDILCIHSEPHWEAEGLPGLCKKGPHLHVSAAKHPIPKVHFPLTLGHIEQVMESCDTLSAAMSLALQVVQEEVVPRFE